MQKSAPSPARILTMAAFALSCFGLLLFLWLSFGGAVPLKPKGYRVQVAFPEAPTLATEADVRVAGVSVGRVVTKRLERGRNRTLATLELDPGFAPLATDARAILRQKTLLGETYIELTPGSGRRTIPEGGRLADGQVADAVQLDEIFQALDPRTRRAFRTWQQQLAEGVRTHGRDLNDALGTLPGFAGDAADVLSVLHTQQRALGRLVRNTGEVFGAVTQNEGQLRRLITSSGRLFDSTARQARSLGTAIEIFPTFLDESRSTMQRLQRFAVTTDPLMRDLRPAAHDLAPTLRDVHALAPDLRRTFRQLDPLTRAARTGLPAFTATLHGLKPLLGQLGPFLMQLNPVLDYLGASQMEVTDFLANGAAGVADTTSTDVGVGHYLRQLGPEGVEAAAIWGTRLPTDRGNSYLKPLDLFPGPEAAKYFIFPNYDCLPTAGKAAEPDAESGGDHLGCFVGSNLDFQGKLQGRFPHVEADSASGR
ncbi:MAG: phospholipid/cholesterol/gamma-HCH transport system substrate-binding protein [Solirubrobacteraceae bacterium]|nr:phospholipid/cholesterol/gamma-HCH transport system substrate-binding protein [Solirubrobacteraceae bacterium]